MRRYAYAYALQMHCMSINAAELSYRLKCPSTQLTHSINVHNGKQTYRTCTTSGQSNLTQGCIAAAHERCSGTRQVAPMYTPPNTWFRGPTRVHNPNSITTSISISSAVFCKAHGRLPLPPSRLPFPIGGHGHPSNTWFLGPIRVLIPNSISIG